MPVKQTIPYNYGIFFITTTCHNWLPLIEQTNGYDAVYKWFDHLKGKGHFIIGYIIMPNHLHALIAFQNTGKSINTIISNGKALCLPAGRQGVPDSGPLRRTKRNAFTPSLVTGSREQRQGA
jgi:hypothetical protein